MNIYDSSNNPVLGITLDATIQKTGSVLDINTTHADVQLNVAGSQAFELQGSADFTLGADGFNLGPAGFSVSGFSVLGQSFGAVGSQSLTNMAVRSAQRQRLLPRHRVPKPGPSPHCRHQPGRRENSGRFRSMA